MAVIHSTHQPSSKAPLHVLLVEDYEFVAALHKDLLLKLGCKVEVAFNGTEALAMAHQPYDLILLDIGLPDINGIEIAKTLCHRLQPRCPRMVVTTSLPSEDIMKTCLEAGVEQVFGKPIDLKILKNIIFPVDLPA